jgi:hypothetical protein
VSRSIPNKENENLSAQVFIRVLYSWRFIQNPITKERKARETMPSYLSTSKVSAEGKANLET